MNTVEKINEIKEAATFAAQKTEFSWKGTIWSPEEGTLLTDFFEKAFGVRPLACYRDSIYPPSTYGECQEPRVLSISADGGNMLFMPNGAIVRFSGWGTEGLDMQLLHTPV